MDQKTNEIQASVSSALKSAIEVMNLTKPPEASVPSGKNPVLEHVTTTDLRNVNDIYSHLGYGDCMAYFNINMQQIHFINCFLFCPCDSSIGCSYANNAVCNCGRCVAAVGGLLPVYSTNTVHSSSHADQVPCKDTHAVRCLLHYCLSSFSVIDCIPSVRVL